MNLLGFDHFGCVYSFSLEVWKSFKRSSEISIKRSKSWGFTECWLLISWEVRLLNVVQWQIDLIVWSAGCFYASFLCFNPGNTIFSYTVITYLSASLSAFIVALVYCSLVIVSWYLRVILHFHVLCRFHFEIVLLYFSL